MLQIIGVVVVLGPFCLIPALMCLKHYQQKRKLKVGDRVRYQQASGLWFIEEESPPGVFRIGNTEAYACMVPARMLKRVK